MSTALLSVSNILLFAAILGIFWAGQNIFYKETVLYYWGNYIIVMLYIGILYFACKIYNSLNFGHVDSPELVVSWILCIITVNAFEYFQLCLQALRLLPVTGFLLIIAAQIVFIIPAVFLVNKLYYTVKPAHKAIIIYSNKEKADDYCLRLQNHKKKFIVINSLSQDEPQEILLRNIDEAESVFFLNIEEKNKEYLFDYCFARSKHMYILPTFSGVLLHTSQVSWISRTPMFLPGNSQMSIEARFIKRCMDVVVSLLAIILLSGLMAITWLAIRLSDRGPAIYKQTRVTKNAEEFTLYKFRSMRVDAEKDGVARLMSKNDDRVTPIGRFIRRVRIDELPQLFNILNGDMSLVGPRPERPEIIEQYKLKYPNFSFRLKVKAGLTGLAQVFGDYSISPDEKLLLDIMYIEQFSIWQDIKLIMQTVKVLFLPSSTQGVTEKKQENEDDNKTVTTITDKETQTHAK
ncbi:MAG: sugar transferase [Oscillospiraceae bacterium]|nr:sugar transferase [Oscillospiraceae bacterium]